MAKLTRSVENRLNRIPEDFRIFKMKYGEKQAIKKKKPLYSGIIWTQEQEVLFNSFWEKSYGKRISPAWHKLYQSANGVFDEKYFPEYFYTTKIEPKLNPYDYCVAISDKNMLPYLFGGQEGLYIPKVYLVCVKGVFRASENQLLSKKQAVEYLCHRGPCVLKPSVDSGSGSGVFIADIKNGVDSHSGLSVEKIFDSIGRDFVVQEIIHNNTQISAICPKSLNTLRVITYYVENEIHYAPLVLRMGSGSNRVDNIHAGGLCIGINIDGTLKKKAYQLGYGDNNLTFTTHPFSKITFENYYIADIEKVVNIAIELHKRIPQLGIVSWDFTINDKDDATLIEVNCRNQSIWFPQVVNEQSFFGADTEYFCKLL